MSVAVDGSSIRLTRREFELLHYLVQNKNRVVSRDRLLERVWGYDRLVETRSVDVHVGRLRSKLRTAGRQIETVVGLGYRFVDDQRPEADRIGGDKESPDAADTARRLTRTTRILSAVSLLRPADPAGQLLNGVMPSTCRRLQ